MKILIYFGICKFIFFLLNVDTVVPISAQSRARDIGISIGRLPTGEYNAITDVKGVEVGHFTSILDSTSRTGITVIKPHLNNLFQEKVPAAVFVGNGFGKLAGSTQIEELGYMESPIVLTNTLSVGQMTTAVVAYTLSQPGNEAVKSVNAVVGETNDGYLNHIRSPVLTTEDLFKAMDHAHGGKVVEGSVGAGTGTVCFGFKGGIGTSSRVLNPKQGGYTIGVLVQSNFGGSLTIDGVPIGRELDKQFPNERPGSADGSCMIVVATDAPILSRNLKRLANRAMYGLARTGSFGSNGSGDYVLAFSTHPNLRIMHGDTFTRNMRLLTNSAMSPLFEAVIEATEEAIINSLFSAISTQGYQGRYVEALPVDLVVPILKERGAIKE